jgi:hypothetical protein
MSETNIPNSGKRSSEKGGPNLENGASRPRAVAVAAPSDRFGRLQRDNYGGRLPTIKLAE